MENEYLMTNKNLQSIDMKQTLNAWRVNAKDNDSPMSSFEAIYSAQVYYQYEANGEFVQIPKSFELYRGEKNKIMCLDDVNEFNIYNETNQKKNTFYNVYAIKVSITQECLNGKKNQFNIRIRRNKQKAIIMEKYNSKSDKFELVCNTEIYTNYENEGKRYHIIKNLKTDSYGRHSYTVGIYKDTDCPSESDLIKSIAVDESSISDLFSHHIGKTILFLLAVAALGFTWYLISGLALAMQISLAVVFLIFIAFLITDEKKIFSRHQNKYFVG